MEAPDLNTYRMLLSDSVAMLCFGSPQGPGFGSGVLHHMKAVLHDDQAMFQAFRASVLAFSDKQAATTAPAQLLLAAEHVIDVIERKTEAIQRAREAELAYHGNSLPQAEQRLGRVKLLAEMLRRYFPHGV